MKDARLHRLLYANSLDIRGYGCFLAKSSKLLLEHLHLPTGAQSHLCTHIHTDAVLKFDARISKCFKNHRIIQNLNKLGYSDTGLLLGAVKKKWLVLWFSFIYNICLRMNLYSVLLILSSKSMWTIRASRYYLEWIIIWGSPQIPYCYHSGISRLTRCANCWFLPVDSKYHCNFSVRLSEPAQWVSAALTHLAMLWFSNHPSNVKIKCLALAGWWCSDPLADYSMQPVKLFTSAVCTFSITVTVSQLLAKSKVRVFKLMLVCKPGCRWERKTGNPPCIHVFSPYLTWMRKLDFEGANIVTGVIEPS